MAMLYRRVDGRWLATPIADTAGHVSPEPLDVGMHGQAAGAHRRNPLLARASGNGPWFLLADNADARLMHNGQRASAGIRVLAHMDSITPAAGETVYFSTEEPARIEPYAGSSGVSCPRCRDEVLPGQPAVRCPRCGVFHHEMDEQKCWTYLDTCATCAYPTELGASPQWTPDLL